MGTRQYSRQTLASYALFDDARRQGRPPQQALIPLVLPFLAGKGGEQFRPEALATSLQQVFGKNFTSYSAEALAKGLKEEGYLREEAGASDGSVYFYTEHVNDLNLDDTANRAEEDIDIILVEFFDFLSATSPLVRLHYTSDEWRDLFIRWSTTVDVSDKDGLRQWVDKFISKEKRKGLDLDGNMDVEERFFGIDKHVIVLFASFTKWLSVNRSDLFAKLATLAEIGFLVDLISDLREPVRGAPKKISLSVVLDGPVLLDALGLMGPGRFQAAAAMRALCKKHGIKVIVLQHSVEEAREIVRTVLSKAAGLRYGLVADTLRTDRLAERRATNFVAKPDQETSKLGVSIVNADITASYAAKTHFDDDAVHDLASRLPYFDGYVGNRRMRDAKSVGFVMRRRTGTHTSDMFEARYVLLTRSASLAVGAQSYLAKTMPEIPSYAVPPVLEVRHFSTMFLLAFGTGDGEMVSRGELLSSCERMMRTSPQLIKKVRDTVEQLSLFTPEELDAILLDQVALYEVTTATGGDPEVVSPATAEALAKVMREAAAKDERIRHQKELRAAAATHGGVIASLEEQRDQAKLVVATTNLALQRNQSEAGENADVLLREWYGQARIIWSVVVVVTCTISVVAMAAIFVDVKAVPLVWRAVIAGCLFLLAAYTVGNRLIDKFSLLNLRVLIRKQVVDGKMKRFPEGLLRQSIEAKRHD